MPLAGASPRTIHLVVYAGPALLTLLTAVALYVHGSVNPLLLYSECYAHERLPRLSRIHVVGPPLCYAISFFQEALGAQTSQASHGSYDPLPHTLSPKTALLAMMSPGLASLSGVSDVSGTRDHADLPRSWRAAAVMGEGLAFVGAVLTVVLVETARRSHRFSTEEPTVLNRQSGQDGQHDDGQGRNGPRDDPGQNSPSQDGQSRQHDEPDHSPTSRAHSNFLPRYLGVTGGELAWILLVQVSLLTIGGALLWTALFVPFFLRKSLQMYRLRGIRSNTSDTGGDTVADGRATTRDGNVVTENPFTDGTDADTDHGADRGADRTDRSMDHATETNEITSRRSSTHGAQDRDVINDHDKSDNRNHSPNNNNDHDNDDDNTDHQNPTDDPAVDAHDTVDATANTHPTHNATADTHDNTDPTIDDHARDTDHSHADTNRNDRSSAPDSRAQDTRTARPLPHIPSPQNSLRRRDYHPSRNNYTRGNVDADPDWRSFRHPAEIVAIPVAVALGFLLPAIWMVAVPAPSVVALWLLSPVWVVLLRFTLVRYASSWLVCWGRSWGVADSSYSPGESPGESPERQPFPRYRDVEDGDDEGRGNDLDRGDSEDAHNSHDGREGDRNDSMDGNQTLSREQSLHAPSGESQPTRSSEHNPQYLPLSQDPPSSDQNQPLDPGQPRSDRDPRHPQSGPSQPLPWPALFAQSAPSPGRSRPRLHSRLPSQSSRRWQHPWDEVKRHPRRLLFLYSAPLLASLVAHAFLVYVLFLHPLPHRSEGGRGGEDRTRFTRSILALWEVNLTWVWLALVYGVAVECGWRVSLAWYVVPTAVVGPGAGTVLAWIAREHVVRRTLARLDRQREDATFHAGPAGLALDGTTPLR